MSLVFWYLLPLAPFLARFVLWFCHRASMRDVLPEKQNDRETHRGVILALAGFSFSGLLALSVVDKALRQDFRLSIYYLLTSFLAYLFALNLQGYKNTLWHDQLGDALMESASLSLILAVLHTMSSAGLEAGFVAGASALAILVWLIDETIRLQLSRSYLRQKEDRHERQGDLRGGSPEGPRSA